MAQGRHSLARKPYRGKFWIAVYEKDDKRGEKLVDVFENPLKFTRWLYGLRKVSTHIGSAGYSSLQLCYRRLNQAWHYVIGHPYPWKRNGFKKAGVEYYIYFVAIHDKDFDTYLSLDCDRIFDRLYPESSYKIKLQKRGKTNEQNQSISKESH